jgi:hypothetical protein
LSGRAGSAKSTIIHRLAKKLVDISEAFPVLINLRRWTAPDYDAWRSAPEDRSFKLNVLLSKAIPSINLAILDGMDEQILRVLLFDGLNEIRSDVAQEVIECVDDYIRRAAQSVAILTDRVVRRSFKDPERWQLSALKPISEDEIRKHLLEPSDRDAFESLPAEQRQMLGTPLFLDQFLKSKKRAGAATSDTEMRFYFEQQIGLNPDEISAASKASFAIYDSATPTRTFPIEEFNKIAGSQVTEKLKASALRVNQDGLAFFYHHLHHDYLAARHLANVPELWTQHGFDALTFKAASFDALAFALEEVALTGNADQFLQQLYDWNVYAPAYALSEAKYSGNVVASSAMETVICSMLAEKRWDFILATAQRATDALSVFPQYSKARDVLNLASMADLLEYVAAVPLDEPKYQEWKRVFVTPPEASVPDKDIMEITSPNSILGWTLANVLRRTRTTEQMQRKLRALAKETTTNSSVQWRIVHVAGAFATEDNLRFLLTVLDNKQASWARYVALRSIIELAGRSSDVGLRAKAIRSLVSRVEDLGRADFVNEIQRAVFIRVAPSDWADSVLPLLAKIAGRQLQEQDLNNWLRVTQEFKKKYSPAMAI